MNCEAAELSWGSQAEGKQCQTAPCSCFPGKWLLRNKDPTSLTSWCSPAQCPNWESWSTPGFSQLGPLCCAIKLLLSTCRTKFNLSKKLLFLCHPLRNVPAWGHRRGEGTSWGHGATVSSTGEPAGGGCYPSLSLSRGYLKSLAAVIWWIIQQNPSSIKERFWRVLWVELEVPGFWETSLLKIDSVLSKIKPVFSL